jgi:hypothetical protein
MADFAPSPVQRINRFGGRYLGTLTSGGLNRPPVTRVTPTTPSAAAMDFLRTGIAPDVSPSPSPAPNYNTYSGAAALQHARRLTPVSRPPYRPPQQTERANPLTGDNNIQMESTTTAIPRPPFIQRGTGIPGGQDVAPQTFDQDADIGTSMQGTFDRLRGIQAGRYVRRFGQPARTRYPSDVLLR